MTKFESLKSVFEKKEKSKITENRFFLFLQTYSTPGACPPDSKEGKPDQQTGFDLQKCMNGFSSLGFEGLGAQKKNKSAISQAFLFSFFFLQQSPAPGNVEGKKKKQKYNKTKQKHHK